MMPRSHRHIKKIAIPQRLLDEETRLKDQGLTLKGTQYNRDGPNKLSKAITTLLSPYKDMGKTYNAFRTMVAIACFAWNASLVDEPERGEMVKQGVNLFRDKTDAKGLNEFNQFFYELIERKILLYPNDRRFVTSFDVTDTKDTFHVFVISLDPSK
jgi:hypothetical protein